MKKIVIVTDSTADLPLEFVKENNIKVMPLTVTYNNKSYKDCVDLTTEQLLTFLNEGDDLPKTSQVNPKEFYDAYEDILKDEESVILSIHLSSQLSGTFQSANIAKDMLGSDRIYIIDSKSVSFGTGLLIIKALELIKSGIEINEIVNYLTHLADKVKVAFAVDNLEYLRKGGRLSGTQAALGKLLNIKPIIHMEEGKLFVYDKVRGIKKAIARLYEYVDEKNIDVEQPVAVGTIAYKDEIESFASFLRERYGFKKVYTSKVGTVVATYSGEGVIGVYFISK
ncbi:DegV domain-containing protein [Caloramator mitchellensis]|uniref:DegV domain-containing protein n=1 Tax=Caloramator mitchellensis TaxID=908809 RepID=A0A0R3JWV6_CALMK|nr:DegV family protein [Caloramator mitchellensis]KRQ88019.1 DegV domain-containing protein [Caloramator mitchellensis]